MGWVVLSERELNRVEVLAQVDDGRQPLVPLVVEQSEHNNVDIFANAASLMAQF